MAKVDSVEALRELYKQPAERTRRKIIDRLEPHSLRFIELSPFLLIASSGGDGGTDVSPRGEAPGFVQALDPKTLAIPDRPGNNLLDTLTNVIENPEVGLIFLIPGVQETLRINGTAEIHDDDALRRRFEVAGKLPVSVLLVTLRELYLHCAKSILRSRLWEDGARVERAALPTMAEMLRDQSGIERPSESQEEMVARYREVLY